MQIVIDDLSGPQIAAFLEDHLAEMRSVSPPESKHALDLDGLRSAGVIFWSVWDEGSLVGCGALKELDGERCEIKSMRTLPRLKQRGIASLLLQHIIAAAQERGCREIFLETGSMDFFEPARRLYLKHGFEFCTPLGHYREDVNSVHMRLVLH